MVLPSFTGFKPSFTGFYLVLLGFTYRVLFSFTAMDITGRHTHTHTHTHTQTKGERGEEEPRRERIDQGPVVNR